jgi:hypothetical protein
MAYEEEDTCMAYEEEDTCMAYAHLSLSLSVSDYEGLVPDSLL